MWERKKLHFVAFPISPVNDESKLLAKSSDTKLGVLSIEPVNEESKLRWNDRRVKLGVLSIEPVNDEFKTSLNLIKDKLISG